MNWVRQNWHRLVLGIFGLVLVFYVLVFPLVATLIANLVEQPILSKVEPQSFWEIVNQRLMEGLFAGLFFSFGAAVGSFLNVVAYRMPLRKSIVFQPSRCPQCGNRIAAYDNFPVLGWFILKGKCRNCGLSISPRYPLVEGIVGLIFLLFYFRELISGGANLPLRDLSIYRGVVWIILYLKWDMLALYTYHCTWLVLMVVWALFAWDGNRIPISVAIFAVLALVIPPTVLNYLVLVPGDYFNGRTHWAMQPLAKTGMTLAMGGGFGLFLALLSKVLLLPALDGFRGRKRSDESNQREEVREPDRKEAVTLAQAADLTEGLEAIQFSDPENDLAKADVDDAQDGAASVGEPALRHLQEAVLLESRSNIEKVEGTNLGEANRSEGTELLEPQVGALEKLDPLEQTNSSRGLLGSLFACFICSGLALGWQSLAGITFITFAWRTMCWLDRSKRVWPALPFAAWFLTACLVHHFWWRQLIKIW